MTRYLVLPRTSHRPIGTLMARDTAEANAMAVAMYGERSMALWDDASGTLFHAEAYARDARADMAETETMQAMRKH